MTSLPQPSRVRALRRRLLDHYDRHCRNLPWRGETDPYRIWVSEVILQQTRVETAVPFYRRWVERFPTVDALAEADREEVMAAWSGLGYYRRARHLHEAARVVRDRSGGELPSDVRDLCALPGIGAYTAGAVASIAFGRREPAVDGNARRVLARLFDLELPPAGRLQELARALVPPDRPGDFNQALMELGATVCRPRGPKCPTCPVQGLCSARRRGTVQRRPGTGRAKRVPLFEVGTAVLFSTEGRILLARRPEEGLLGGTWEFPGALAGKRESPGRAAWRAAGSWLGRDSPLPDPGPAWAVVPHAFSHLRHVYHVFRFPPVEESEVDLRMDRAEASGTGSDGMPLWTAAAWVRPCAAGRRALPAAQRAILRSLPAKKDL
ncbi:MAG TPA: A/G-specific adenine glycosylase [Gemmatimonadota bacterium]|nr:A/G-specific adenine glycosylase [Gemmatimonadota bacterium]